MAAADSESVDHASVGVLDGDYVEAVIETAWGVHERLGIRNVGVVAQQIATEDGLV